jgi:hypothetical protein
MTLLAATAIVALPASGFAQAPPAQQPATPQSPAASAAQTATADAAKAHLTAARNTLSQLTQLPGAAQLQGETRGQVAQLINNFNELITTQTNWKAAYAKVNANLSALLDSPDDANRPTGTAGAVGTSGTKGLDPAIRAKLVELRAQLDQFEKAAGTSATDAAAAAATATPPPATSTTSSTTTTSTTTSAPPTEAAAPPTTPPTTPPDAPPSVPPGASDPVIASQQDLLRHVEAIEVILSAHAAAQNSAQTAAGGAMTQKSTPSGSTKTTITSSDVLLTPAQLDELRGHLSELRRLIEKK